MNGDFCDYLFCGLLSRLGGAQCLDQAFRQRRGWSRRDAVVMTSFICVTTLCKRCVNGLMKAITFSQLKSPKV